jgi:transposase
MRALVLTGPQELREQFRGTTVYRLVRGAAKLRPGDPCTAVGGTKYALRILAKRVLELEAELAELKAILRPLVAATAPELVARHGVGTFTTGALLVAAGDNPERLRDERAFAHFCGVSPIDASSGTVVRKRLNRGGDRHANEALWRIVMVRMVSDPATRHYVERRTKEGLSTLETMRCLKRYVARELYPFLAAGPLDIDRSIIIDRSRAPQRPRRRPRRSGSRLWPAPNQEERCVSLWRAAAPRCETTGSLSTWVAHQERD